MKTLVIPYGGDITPAAQIIRDGGLVAVPTETVYGLCCDGFNDEAVRRLYDVKGRAPVKPISLLVSDIGHAGLFCKVLPPVAEKLAAAFWPGPLTIVVEKSPDLSDVVTAGLDTVGIRCPDNALALRLIRMSGKPLAAPSCNPSDDVSATDADMALRYFDGVIDCVIDGGKCDIGAESTVVSVTREGVRFLRVGAIPPDAILSALVLSDVVLDI
jgi:L-threonylcarbamoyladenylate synthase